MTAMRELSSEPALHVFEQDGEWNWALTVKRIAGVGVRVVAFGETGFRRQADAYRAGECALSSYNKGASD